MGKSEKKMEKMMKATFLLLVVVAAMGYVAVADMKFCNMSYTDLLACRPAVSGMTPAMPSKACCDALAGADMGCLCNYKLKKGSNMAMFGVDPNLAIQLPTKCNLPPPNC